jgi:hypothetical protein
VTSQNDTVTVFRTSPTGAAGSGSAAPQALQNLDPAGFSAPQLGHSTIAGEV